MLINQYHNNNNGKISFTRQQSSDFAKVIADDFNPIHDIDAKRFCVPGDLLFAIILSNYGASQHMLFNFTGMVTEDTQLALPDKSAQLSIQDENAKECLSIEHSGENSTNSELIDNLIRSYVTFSGHTFPHILVPLLQEQNVMIHPTRPMVMYQSMLIKLDRLDLTDIELELDKENTTLEVNGKRGNICLAFNLKSGDQLIGRGEKHMIASGLKLFEQEAVNGIKTQYSNWKKQFVKN
jgi:hypothetical protein